MFITLYYDRVCKALDKDIGSSFGASTRFPIKNHAKARKGLDKFIAEVMLLEHVSSWNFLIRVGDAVAFETETFSPFFNEKTGGTKTFRRAGGTNTLVSILVWIDMTTETFRRTGETINLVLIVWT